MPRFEVAAIVATTDRIPARGIRLAPEALNAIAEQFRPGMPIFKNHGATRIGEWHRVEVRTRPDGEHELYAEGEVEVPEGESYEGYLGPAWSIAFAESPTLRGDEVAIVAIDSLAFEQLGLEG